jgi:hypothetical protein
MLSRLSKLYRRLSHQLSGAKIVLELEAGGLRMNQGKLLTRHLRDTLEVLTKHQLTHGWIRGFEGGGYTRWEFSPEIPSTLHQTLRNILSEAT